MREGRWGALYSTLACYGSAGFEKSKLLSKLYKWAILQRDGGLLITVSLNRVKFKIHTGIGQ
jgi:hypothetical protein